MGCLAAFEYDIVTTLKNEFEYDAETALKNELEHGTDELQSRPDGADELDRTLWAVLERSFVAAAREMGDCIAEMSSGKKRKMVALVFHSIQLAKMGFPEATSVLRAVAKQQIIPTLRENED